VLDCSSEAAMTGDLGLSKYHYSLTPFFTVYAQ
jgi:hypothetical protein